ncbi:MAG TPA: hypothetical protein VFO39_20560 [Candidatus Sulfotelmatobacter sp.]|nr:hypothetical protein [Candidatus Sulfotelmatobacter sp.]
MSYESTWLPRCAVCKESVNLEESNTDEHGQPVHENCYIWTVELKKPPRYTPQINSVEERLHAQFQQRHQLAKQNYNALTAGNECYRENLAVREACHDVSVLDQTGSDPVC